MFLRIGQEIMSLLHGILSGFTAFMRLNTIHRHSSGPPDFQNYHPLRCRLPTTAYSSCRGDESSDSLTVEIAQRAHSFMFCYFADA